jgi:hypothetical protein
MFPFDSTIFVGILIVLTLAAYALILKKLAPRPIQTKLPLLGPEKNSKSKLKSKIVKKRVEKLGEKRVEKLGEKRVEKLRERIVSKPVVFEKPESLCSQYFGYLRTLPKNTSIPDECLGCSQIVDCLTFVDVTE